MSIDIDQVLDWRGHTVVDRNGKKVGTLEEIYLDEGTSEPLWAAVKTGPMGLRQRVVPIAGAESDGGSVCVPFTKEQVRSAPSIDSEGWVRERDQETIFRHYGVSSEHRQQVTDGRPEGTPTEADPAAAQEPATIEGDASEGPPSEREPHRMRLKRYTVTETATRRSEFEE